MGLKDRDEESDLLGDADTGVTSSETDAVDCRVLSQEVSNLRSLAYNNHYQCVRPMCVVLQTERSHTNIQEYEGVSMWTRCDLIAE